MLTWTNEKRKLKDLIPWPRNPRQIQEEQAERLAESWQEFGQVETLAIGPGNEIYNGHQRLNVLAQERGPDYEVDVRVSSRPLTEKEREKLTVYLHKGATGEWDWDLLGDFDTDDLLEWGFEESELEFADDDFLSVAPDAKPNPRKLPIDVIFTQTFRASCCLAVAAGLKYGLQSTKEPCLYAEHWRDHKVCFVDNDYFNYDHQQHLDMIKRTRPKYATAMDVMTKEQCAKAGIEWRPLEQILDWAVELGQFAENVIVIPKYDCLDKIPAHYVLGYSVPTSHGGTPLPVAAFRGRRVHLLGGSWKAQLAHMAELGEDVVSLDNNHISRISQLGGAILPSGERRDLPAYGIDTRVNPAYIALAISIGNLAWSVNELFSQAKEKISNSLAVAVTRLNKTRRIQCIALS